MYFYYTTNVFTYLKKNHDNNHIIVAIYNYNKQDKQQLFIIIINKVIYNAFLKINYCKSVL